MRKILLLLISNVALASFSIPNGSVTTNKIASTAVTTAKIANNAVTATQIANATITGTQVSSNIDLPGTQVRANGKNLIATRDNAAGSNLSVVRGCVNGSGTTIQGEGFSSSRTTTGAYFISFSVAFSTTPVVVVSLDSPPGAANTTARSSGTDFQVDTFNGAFANTDKTFCFIAIGI